MNRRIARGTTGSLPMLPQQVNAELLAATNRKSTWATTACKVLFIFAFGFAWYVSDPRSWELQVDPYPLSTSLAITGSSKNRLIKSNAISSIDSMSESRRSMLSATTLLPSLIPQPFADNRYVERSLDDYHDLCVVGAGLSGTVIAERYANVRNQTSLVIERRDHIAGNCYDYIDEETGIRVSKYGAHLFHTYFERVWDYVQKFSDWTKYEHEVVALVDGKHVPVPVNIDTVNSLFGLSIDSESEMDEWLKKEQVKFDIPKNSEEMALSRVGQRLYRLIFHPYTIKQWAKEPKELGPEVTARIPVRNNRDSRYFSDPHQALPKNGYTAIFEKMMDNPLITLKTNTDFFEVRERLRCGKIYYTGPIDRYFADLGWNKLEYRSLDFGRQVIKNIDFFQPKGVVNHPNATTNYTRIVEYKHFLNQTSDHTILFFEYSKDDGEPYYPVPNPENENLFKKYQAMADMERGVTFAGRLANYKYFNMDQTIENALSLFEKDTQSLDLIVSYCEGDDLNWIKEWHVKLKISHTYVYASCEAPSVEADQIAKAFTRALNMKTAIASGAQGNEDSKEGLHDSIPFEKANKIMKDGIQPVVDHGSADSITLHFLRKDIEFGSQSVFVQGNTKMTAEIVQNSVKEIEEWTVFIDFAKLPFKGCETSKCDRNFNPEVGSDFYVTQEAIKRYLSVNLEELRRRGAAQE